MVLFACQLASWKFVEWFDSRETTGDLVMIEGEGE